MTGEAISSEGKESEPSQEPQQQQQPEQQSESQKDGQKAEGERTTPNHESEVHEAAEDSHQQQEAGSDADAVRDQTSDGPSPFSAPKTLQQHLKVPEWRKSSTVSFKDVAELFEIDLEANKRPERPPAVFSLRFYIMILALVSPFVVTYSKTIINFAIIDMIEPTYLNDHNAKGNNNSAQPKTLATNPDSEIFTQTPYFDLDNSCPVDETTRERLLKEATEERKQARGGQSERFEWDTVKQGLLKSAYSIGHMLLQVVGGRLSEIYGPHLIMGSSAALIGLSCLGAPFLASAHFYLLFADLFFLGLLGSFMTPALITFFSNWLTPSEKSIMLSFYLVSSRLGYALSSLLCGILIQAQLSWRYLFYSAGWVSLAFSFLFFICARSRPHEHPLMRKLELDYLASKNTLVREAIAKSKRKARGLDGEKQTAFKMEDIKPKEEASEKGDETAAEVEKDTQVEGRDSKESNKSEAVDGEGGQKSKQKSRAKKAPWLAIFTNKAVWAFMVTKFCVKLAGDTVQIELPTYLKRVMHLGARHNGIINASNYVIFCFSCLLVGWLARLANKRHPFGWTKTTVRKVFQCTASCGVALSLLGITYSVCRETATLALLMTLFFFTTFSTGGEAQIPLDISERYAGTIHAIGSQVAISGVIEPILVGFVLRGSPADRDRWAGVWMGASAVAFLGGLTFAIFGDATIQPFDKIKLDDEENASSSSSSSPPQKEEEAAKRTSVELKGHANGSFQMSDEMQNAQQPASEEEGDHVQPTAPQRAEI